jgi:choline dehydrogenase-like flavoprotein
LKQSTEVLVIGSGAGGALTAATLAEAGLSVTLVEEGSELGATPMETHSPEALLRLYRNAGLSPILGTHSIAFGEGRCVGGSTEVNSAFWHRPPADALERWRSRYAVRELGEDSLAPLFLELERELQPTLAGPERLPPGSRVLARGLERCGLPARETPRLQSGDPTTSQFGPGAKRSMSRTYIPRALAAGATLVSGTRAVRIHHRRRRATGASLVQTTPEGPRPLRTWATRCASSPC